MVPAGHGERAREGRYGVTKLDSSATLTDGKVFEWPLPFTCFCLHLSPINFFLFLLNHLSLPPIPIIFVFSFVFVVSPFHFLLQIHELFLFSSSRSYFYFCFYYLYFFIYLIHSQPFSNYSVRVQFHDFFSHILQHILLAAFLLLSFFRLHYSGYVLILTSFNLILPLSHCCTCSISHFSLPEFLCFHYKIAYLYILYCCDLQMAMR